MASYNNGSSTIYSIKKWKNKLQSLMASSKSVNDLLKQETMRKPKLPQLYVVLCKWSTAMNFEGKLITGPMLTEKANSFSSSNKNS
jgi:hypothetical protein